MVASCHDAHGNSPRERKVIRVAVTRPEPQASGTARRLAQAGYIPVLAPLLAPIATGHPGTGDGIGTIALTSRTAAMVLGAYPALHGLPVVAVGDATAREARQAGFRVVASAGGDVTTLLAALVGAAEPIVHMAGAEQIGDLVEHLLARGQMAARRTLYKMEPVALPSVAPVAAVLIYSPRTARLFAASDAPAFRDALCVALSAAIAAALVGRRVVVAATPTEPAILAALRQALPASRAPQVPVGAAPSIASRSDALEPSVPGMKLAEQAQDG